MSNTFYVIPKNSDLQHYGVLGMKWGVRRYQNKDGSLTPAGEKRYSDNSANLKQKVKVEKRKLTTKEKIAIGAGAVAVAAAAIGGMYVYKKVKLDERDSALYKDFNYGSTVNLSTLSNESKTISKDQTIQRISSKQLEDYSEEGKRIFAAYLDKDKAFYKTKLPDFIKAWHDAGLIEGRDAYVLKLSLNKDIKLASDKDVADSYMKIFNTNKIDKGEYQHFMTFGLNDTKDPKIKDFYNDLRNKGFDGMVDKNDQGWSKEPVIIFNPKEVVKDTQSHKLSGIEKVLAVFQS